MNTSEDTHVREKAIEWQVSLNLAICMMIQEHEKRERYAELMLAKKKRDQTQADPPPAPAPPRAAPRELERERPPALPRKPRQMRKATGPHTLLTPPPADDSVPGQTAITDPDQ